MTDINLKIIGEDLASDALREATRGTRELTAAVDDSLGPYGNYVATEAEVAQAVREYDDAHRGAAEATGETTSTIEQLGEALRLSQADFKAGIISAAEYKDALARIRMEAIAYRVQSGLGGKEIAGFNSLMAATGPAATAAHFALGRLRFQLTTLGLEAANISGPGGTIARVGSQLLSVFGGAGPAIITIATLVAIVGGIRLWTAEARENAKAMEDEEKALDKLGKHGKARSDELRLQAAEQRVRDLDEARVRAGSFESIGTEDAYQTEREKRLRAVAAAQNTLNKATDDFSEVMGKAVPGQREMIAEFTTLGHAAAEAHTKIALAKQGIYDVGDPRYADALFRLETAWKGIHGGAQDAAVSMHHANDQLVALTSLWTNFARAQHETFGRLIMDEEFQRRPPPPLPVPAQSAEWDVTARTLRGVTRPGLGRAGIPQIATELRNVSRAASEANEKISRMDDTIGRLGEKAADQFGSLKGTILDLGGSVLAGFSSAMQGAFAAMIAEGRFSGKELAKGILSGIAQSAAAKSAYYFAEGLAALAASVFPFPQPQNAWAAGQYFQAAAGMAVVAATFGAAAAAIPGSKGGSGRGGGGGGGSAGSSGFTGTAAPGEGQGVIRIEGTPLASDTRFLAELNAALAELRNQRRLDIVVVPGSR